MRAEQARARAQELAHLNAFIALTEETGGQFAVAVKDNIAVAGTPTTGGGPNPLTELDRDADVIRLIRAAGGRVMGKANLHE